MWAVGLGPYGNANITKPEFHKEQLPELEFKNCSVHGCQLPLHERLGKSGQPVSVKTSVTKGEASLLSVTGVW